MKKLLTLIAILAISTNVSLAANNFGSALKYAVEQDIKDAKASVKSDAKALKNAVKQDIENQKQTQETTAATKKEEKIKQIDKKLEELNSELTTVKNDKTIMETERLIKVKTIQRQIDFYNNQKKALQ